MAMKRGNLAGNRGKSWDGDVARAKRHQHISDI